MADSLMFNFDHQNSPVKPSPSSSSRCNGECHRNKFSKYASQDIIPEGSYNDISFHLPEPTNQIRRRKIEEHVEEFIGSSTLHGFHYCFDKRYKARRIIWTLIVLGSVGILLQKLYQSGSKFFEYPFSSTSTIIDVEELDFPAISICNINDFRMSIMNNTKLHRLLQGEPNLTYDHISGHEYASTTRSSNHILSDMIYFCDFLSQPCSAKNFSVFYQTQGEKCHTINSGDVIKENRGVVTGTGTKHSFEMILNIEHYEYYIDTKDSGMRLIIHDPNETPVRFQGLSISPGFSTYVQIKRKKTVNLQLPYKTACGSRELKYFKHYSENTCWLERLTDHVVKHCNCKDGFMPGSARVCSIKELMNCTWPEWSVFNKFKDINCPVACEVNEFEPLISMSQFPSNEYADYIADEFGLKGTAVENRMFVRDNFLRFVIYFDHLSYVKMEQTPSYDIMIFLGDIGGQLGLFLGTSILTYIEFFDALAIIIYTKYFEMFRAK